MFPIVFHSIPDKSIDFSRWISLDQNIWLFTIFNITPAPGLSNYLSGVNSNGENIENDIGLYIRGTEINNLYIMTSGTTPPNPSELLVSERMSETMAKLASICDVVIYDGTPTSLVTDALIISRKVDTTIIVCEHKKTKMEQLEKVKKDILNVGGKIGGVVLNKVPISQKQYYSSYYYTIGNPLAMDKERKKNSKQIKNKRF